MLTNIEAIAEDYCSLFSDCELVSVKDNGVDLCALKDWMESEIDESFSNEDVEDLNNEIMNYAEWVVNESKQTAAQELRDVIENAIDTYCEILEDYEVASILADYITAYLPSL